MFVVVEFFAENPIVNLRTFRNLSFSSGNIIMFFAFFNLFGSIVLLPIYLQTLMGYTSFLAGLVLGPGGIATMIAMPIAGRLVTKINPKAILAFGIAVAAYSVHLMAQFNLYADFNTIIWPRVVLGVGMGFLFIPLTTIDHVRHKKGRDGKCHGDIQPPEKPRRKLWRCLCYHPAGQKGTVSSGPPRGASQPLDRNFQLVLPRISQGLLGHGFGTPFPSPGGEGVVYGQLLRQAGMLAFNDVFSLLAAMMALILPFVLLMRKGAKEVSAPIVH